MKPISKSKQLDKNTKVRIEAGWIDTSFSHELGTQRQGFYEVTNVLINEVDIPLDILDREFLESMDKLANE